LKTLTSIDLQGIIHQSWQFVGGRLQDVVIVDGAVVVQSDGGV
jgi:hypothetical protein